MALCRICCKSLGTMLTRSSPKNALIQVMSALGAEPLERVQTSDSEFIPWWCAFSFRFSTSSEHVAWAMLHCSMMSFVQIKTRLIALLIALNFILNVYIFLKIEEKVCHTNGYTSPQ